MSPSNDAILERIETKIDALTEQLSTSKQTLGRHDERLKHVEAMTEKQGDRRWTIIGFVAASIIGALIGKMADALHGR